MKFKSGDPYRKVELVAKKHVNFVMTTKDKDEVWSILDHFFWEAFDAIISNNEKKGKK